MTPATCSYLVDFHPILAPSFQQFHLGEQDLDEGALRAFLYKSNRH